MKYNNNILNNKVQILSTLCICVILLCVSLIVFIAPINLTYADTLTDSSVLEFNQLLNIDRMYTGKIEKVNNITLKGLESATNVYEFAIINDINFISSHKYYIKCTTSQEFAFAYNYSQPVYFRESTILSNVSGVRNQLYLYSVTLDEIYSFNLIDLTQMFGAGYEPTLEQINANNLFSTFYNYNTGTPITNGEFSKNSQVFMDGYNSALSNYLNSIETVSAFSNSYSNLTYATIAGYTGTDMTKGIEVIDGNEVNIVIYGADTLALAPFIVKGNTQVNLTFEYFQPLHTPQTSDYPIYYRMYAIQGNNLNEIWSYTANDWYQATSIKNVSFVAPFNMNGIYIECSEDFYIANMTAEYKTNDLGLLISSSTESGYKAGYNDGYNIGYSEGGINALATGKTWENAWSFISNTFTNIGNILDIKIFGDIPLWTFIAIPLLFGLIVFIFKMTGGN